MTDPLALGDHHRQVQVEARAGQLLGVRVQVVHDGGGVRGERDDPLHGGAGVQVRGQLVAADGVRDGRAGAEVVELTHRQVLPHLRHVLLLGPGALGEVAQVQPRHVVPEPVRLGGGGGPVEVLHRRAVGAPGRVRGQRLLPGPLVLGGGVHRVERGVGEQQPTAEADRRTAVVLAVVVVDGVLGDHQPGGDHDVVDAGRVGVAADHVAADREAVELLLVVRREELHLLGPQLDPPAHLGDPHRVRLGDRVEVQPGDRVADARLPRCRRCRRLRCSGGLLTWRQTKSGRAQTARSAEDLLQRRAAHDRTAGRRPGCGCCDVCGVSPLVATGMGEPSSCVRGTRQNGSSVVATARRKGVSACGRPVLACCPTVGGAERSEPLRMILCTRKGERVHVLRLKPRIR